MLSKIHFNFDKFPESNPVLGTAMKSVGEAMSIGHTFKEAMQKGLRSLESKRFSFGNDGKDLKLLTVKSLFISYALLTERMAYLKYAIDTGMSLEELHDTTKIDPWFLIQFQQLVKFPETMKATEEDIREAKRLGFSDLQISTFSSEFNSEMDVRAFKKKVKTYYLLIN